MGAFRDRRVDRLSKGMAQKVLLDTALFNSPKPMLRDEPYSGPFDARARSIKVLDADQEAARSASPGLST
jgi:ABC-type Mn2+/Zn2+ transport system ATPase subunit